MFEVKWNVDEICGIALKTTPNKHWTNNIINLNNESKNNKQCCFPNFDYVKFQSTFHSSSEYMYRPIQLNCHYWGTKRHKLVSWLGCFFPQRHKQDTSLWRFVPKMINPQLIWIDLLNAMWLFTLWKCRNYEKRDLYVEKAKTMVLKQKWPNIKQPYSHSV